MNTTKAYDSGFDYYISGGRNRADNPYPSGSTSASDWIQGFEDAQDATELDEEYNFSDNCTH